MSKKMKKSNQVTNQMMGIVGNQTIGVVGNQTIGVKAESDHVQIVGTAHFDGHRLFMFQPDDPIPGCVARFRQSGMAQQMSDGTFDFVPKTKKPTEPADHQVGTRPRQCDVGRGDSADTQSVQV